MNLVCLFVCLYSCLLTHSFHFLQIVSVVLENYGGSHKESSDSNQNRWLEEVQKTEGHVTPSDVLIKVPSWRMILNDKGQLNVTAYVLDLFFYCIPP